MVGAEVLESLFGLLPAGSSKAVALLVATPPVAINLLDSEESVDPTSLSELGVQQLTNALRTGFFILTQDDTNSQASELRFTVFVPDYEKKTLVQVARYCWNGNVATSDTEIRMGTGLVGSAFTTGDVLNIPNAENYEVIWRGYGAEKPEIAGYHKVNCLSFKAIPIVDGATRLGVLALDSAVRGYFAEEDHGTNKLVPVLKTISDVLIDEGIKTTRQWRWSDSDEHNVAS